MSIYIVTVKPLGHWIQIPFNTRLWTPLKELYGLPGIEFQIPLMGLSGFWVTLEGGRLQDAVYANTGLWEEGQIPHPIYSRGCTRRIKYRK